MIQESPAFRHGECQERAHIRPVLDYLKLLYSPCNELAFWNLFELVDGVGPKRVRAIFESFRENHQCDIEDLAKLSIPKKAGDDFQKLSYALQEGKAFLDSNPEADDEISVLQYLCKTFLEGIFYEKMRVRYSDEERAERMPDFDILLAALNAYNSLDEFLENVALETKKDDTEKEDSVHILSIHKAKGLEWDKVFLPFFNQGILPLGDDLEEERRLCYVAITRARKELDMSSVNTFVRLEHFDGRLSEFLAEQPRDLYKEEKPEQYGFRDSCSEFGQEYWARMFGDAS